MEENKKTFADEQLEKVNGGVSTHMQCTFCPPGFKDYMWAGDYRGKGPFKCPHCGGMTLFGTDDIAY